MLFLSNKARKLSKFSDSEKPASSDGSQKPPPKKAAVQKIPMRKPGAQPGHEGRSRVFVPPGDVHDVMPNPNEVFKMELDSLNMSLT